MEAQREHACVIVEVEGAERGKRGIVRVGDRWRPVTHDGAVCSLCAMCAVAAYGPCCWLFEEVCVWVFGCVGDFVVVEDRSNETDMAPKQRDNVIAFSPERLRKRNAKNAKCRGRGDSLCSPLPLLLRDSPEYQMVLLHISRLYPGTVSTIERHLPSGWCTKTMAHRTPPSSDARVEKAAHEVPNAAFVAPALHVEVAVHPPP